MHKLIQLTFIICFITQPIFADAKPVTNTLTSEALTFDVTSANKEFDKMNLSLSTKGLEQTTLKNAVKTLKSQISKAEECINTNEKKVTNLDYQIQEANKANQTTDKVDKGGVDNKSTADLVYLTKERKKIADILAQCRLFSIRANEALEVYQTNLSRIKKEKILEHGKPFWINIEHLFNKDIVFAKTPLQITDIPPQILNIKTLYLILGASFLLAALIFYKFHTSKKIRHYINVKKLYFRSFVLLFAGLACLTTTGYLNILYAEIPNSTNFFLWIITAIGTYLLSMFLIMVLYNIKKIKALFCVYSLDSQFFKLLTMLVITLYATNEIGKAISRQVDLNHLLWDVWRSMLLYIDLIMAISFVFYFCYAHRQINLIRKYKTIIKVTSTLMFVSFAILNLIGYNLLSVHLTFSGIITLTIIFATIILEQAISRFYNMCISDEQARTKLKYIFGYKQEQTLTEILILKTTIQLIIALGAIYLISQSWGYALESIDITFKYILNGIKFENFTFNPARIISGVIVFCVLYLIFRSISTSISRHKQFDREEETQVAVASILTYIGFGVAIISALLIAGFDFTGLAIVAGALSVGIGLGLQSIVNNFVSGLILLIEKPIKPGDKISVDGVEGYVKKIRARSTQILTPSREDMIIPNSDLITRRVTNFMYSDKHLNVCCEMGVSYESDIDLTIALLTDIATKHPEVITTIKNNKPRVFLRAFGDSSILIQLWFLIKDANRKAAVRSEIYIEIFKAFKENNITIACPKRDIKLKMSDIAPIQK